MRACATEPSITTSNVSRGPVPTQSNKRATDLLSQVAYVSGSPPDSLYRGSSRSSTQSTIYDRLDTASVMSAPSSGHHEVHDDMRLSPCATYPFSIDDVHHGLAQWSDSGRYLSFPSFDTWDPSEDKEEGEMKAS